MYLRGGGGAITRKWRPFAKPSGELSRELVETRLGIGYAFKTHGALFSDPSLKSEGVFNSQPPQCQLLSIVNKKVLVFQRSVDETAAVTCRENLPVRPLEGIIL